MLWVLLKLPHHCDSSEYPQYILLSRDKDNHCQFSKSGTMFCSIKHLRVLKAGMINLAILVQEEWHLLEYGYIPVSLSTIFTSISFPDNQQCHSKVLEIENCLLICVLFIDATACFLQSQMN